MLIIVKDYQSLDIAQLLQLYGDELQTRGKKDYPKLPAGIALEYAELDLKEYLQEHFFAVKDALYGILLIEGQYVSALRMEPYQDGYLLHALHTDRYNRRKGFGRKLVQSVLDYIGPNKVYSHVKKENVASVAFHLAMGFLVVSQSAIYLDGTCDQECYTFCKYLQ